VLGLIAYPNIALYVDNHTLHASRTLRKSSKPSVFDCLELGAEVVQEVESLMAPGTFDSTSG